MMTNSQTSTRAQVPCSKVGPGWELVQYNAASGTGGGHITAGPTTLYKTRALFTVGSIRLQQLTLKTGKITPIVIPPSNGPVGLAG